MTETPGEDPGEVFLSDDEDAAPTATAFAWSTLSRALQALGEPGFAERDTAGPPNRRIGLIIRVILVARVLLARWLFRMTTNTFTHGVKRRGLAVIRNPVVRRAVLVIALAGIAGAVAYLMVAGAAPQYERTVSQIVVPDINAGPTDVSSQIVTTIAGGIGSKVFLTQSAHKVLGRPPGKAYTLDAFVRPGSDIIDTRLRGPSRDVLTALGKVYVHDSHAWTAQHYTAYDLAFLESGATPGLVSPHPKRMAAEGIVLGGLLGILVLFVELQLRQGRRLPRVSWEAAPGLEEAPVDQKPSLLRDDTSEPTPKERTAVARRQRERQRRQ